MYLYITIMNISEYDNKIFGLEEGISYGQFDRLDELNDRMFSRNLPATNTQLEPNFDIRSVPTRNCLVFPVLDLKSSSRTTIQKHDYNTERNFAPMNKPGPIKGFVSNIHTESQLRNQYYSLQHGADQGIYIPSSTSDLYRVPAPVTLDPQNQPFNGLFERNSYITTGNDYINNSNIGKDTFNNNTKVQLRNM
jgi:hypothetical protein